VTLHQQKPPLNILECKNECVLDGVVLTFSPQPLVGVKIITQEMLKSIYFADKEFLAVEIGSSASHI
jgi:hypothetical protein